MDDKKNIQKDNEKKNFNLVDTLLKNKVKDIEVREVISNTVYENSNWSENGEIA